ncbi:MAG: LamB/YcsF family protein [Salinibacterium sp.]|nr:LamB/YcsF family protein [Salinibacterium sp.]
MRIDLNADLAESFGRWTLGDDEAMLAVVSSANVACGFHAGDPLAIRTALDIAQRNSVTVGAHVSYRDLAGFGRRFLDATPAELEGDVVYQLGALAGMAHAVGSAIRYIKPHGALYNRIQWDAVHAQAVIDGARQFGLPVMGMPGSVVLRLAAEAGLATITEAFADRAYNADGSLVSRDVPGALIDDPVEVAEQAVRIATLGTVDSVEGTLVDLGQPDSLCLHSDTPGAASRARLVRAALDAAGIAVVPVLAP